MDQPIHYVGIDLHRHYSTISVIDADGEQIQKASVKNRNTEELLNVFSNKVQYVASVEATYAWYWLADTIQTLDNVTLKLAHAQKVKRLNVTAQKTDKVDAKLLANLTRVGMLPESHITSVPMREVKEILRMRAYIVKQRTGYKIKLRDLIAKLNKICEAEDIASKKARTWIEENITQFPYNKNATHLLQMIDTATETIHEYDKQVKEYCKQFSQIELLKTIPGIGNITALTLLCEIDDINRFKTPGQLFSYAGLVPTVSSSGGKTHYGRLRKGNTWIKAVLGEASMVAIRKDEWLKQKYEQIKDKKHAKSARVVIMRKLLNAVYQVLVKQEAYKPMAVKGEQA